MEQRADWPEWLHALEWQEMAAIALLAIIVLEVIAIIVKSRRLSRIDATTFGQLKYISETLTYIAHRLHEMDNDPAKAPIIPEQRSAEQPVSEPEEMAS